MDELNEKRRNRIKIFRLVLEATLAAVQTRAIGPREMFEALDHSIQMAVLGLIKEKRTPEECLALYDSEMATRMLEKTGEATQAAARA